MSINFMPYFEEYEKLVSLAGQAFERVNNEYPDKVKCIEGCSDCCYALFDLSFIEAYYINYQFHKKYKGREKEDIIAKANAADRIIYKLKRIAHKDFKAGMDEAEIFVKMSKERVKCPLLDDKEMCCMYEHRPITCRLYGIPTAIGGIGHTCGLSGFEEGVEHSTVNLEIIQNRLYEISTKFVSSMNTKYKALKEMLVPLSMVLCQEYDEDYLGIIKESTADTNTLKNQGVEK